MLIAACAASRNITHRMCVSRVRTRQFAYEAYLRPESFAKWLPGWARWAGEFWRWHPAGNGRICRGGTDGTGYYSERDVRIVSCGTGSHAGAQAID